MHASIGQDPRVSQRGGAGHLWRLRHGGQDGPGKKVRNIARIIKLNAVYQCFCLVIVSTCCYFYRYSKSSEEKKNLDEEYGAAYIEYFVNRCLCLMFPLG